MLSLTSFRFCFFGVTDSSSEHDPLLAYSNEQAHDRLCGAQHADSSTPSSQHSLYSATKCTAACACACECSLPVFISISSSPVKRYLQPFLGYFLIVGPSHHACEDSWEESQNKKTIRAENEVEANKLVNNYRVRNQKSFAQEKKVSRVEDTGVIAVCVCVFISLGLESGRAT